MTIQEVVVADHAPMFDPAIHLNAEGVALPEGDDERGPMVYVELYCQCGGIRRQRDPVAYVLTTVRDFQAQHGGPGCGTAAKATCVEEREARRKAAFRQVGRLDDYERQPYEHLDATCTLDRPWPDLSTAGRGI